MVLINGQAIRLKDYERQLVIYKSMRPEASLDEGTRRELLEQMAKQALLTQEAQKAGLDADPAVKAAISQERDAVRKELLGTLANAQAQLEQLDSAVEQKVLIDRLLQARQGGLKASEAELKAAYQAHLDLAKASHQALAPYAQLRSQLIQQVQAEKLVAQIQAGAQVKFYPEAAARAELPKE